MRKLDLLTAFILLNFMRGCSSKEIFVSQLETISADDETCGNSTNPCRTIAYALTKIHDDRSIVNIDGGLDTKSPYVYQVYDKIKISHSIVLQKWEHDGDKNFSPKPILRQSKEESRLIFSSNITLLSIQLHSHSILHRRFVVFEDSCTKLNVTNCLFQRTDFLSYDIEGRRSSNKSLGIYVSSSSQFKIDVAGIMFTTAHMATSRISIKKDANYFFIYNSRIISDLVQITDSQNLYILNCEFESTSIITKCYNLVIHNSTFKSGEGKFNAFFLNISTCLFVNTITHISEDNEQAYDVMAKFRPEMLPLFRKYLVFIINSTFVNKNPENILPALTLWTSGSNIVLIRCSFRNNTSIVRSIASSLSTEGVGASQLHDCNFHAYTNNEIIANYSLENAYFSNTSITCKDRDFMENYLYNIKASYLRCQTCGKSTYRFGDTTTITNSSLNETQNNQSCIPCPFNSICENGGIRLKGGYWGYVDTRNAHTKTLSLIACPAYYCCSSKEQCTSYNTCVEHRTGRLCSKCQPGYSSDMSAKYQCTSNSKCHNAKITCALYIFLAVIFIVILLYLKEIILFVKTFTKSGGNEPITNSADNAATENEDAQLREKLLHEGFEGHPRPPSPYQFLQNNDINRENYRKLSSNMISGSLKILFFFYQAASLIRIQSVDKIEVMFPKFFDFITSTFNIKLDLSYSQLTVCILPNINVIQVKVIKLGFILIVLALIMIFWTVTCVCKAVKHRKKILADRSVNTYTHIDDDVPSYCNPPFIVRVKCVYVQFLLIAYASIATFSFDALHCVDINGDSYLYTQASIRCYQPWQYGLIVFIALWVIPFALSLYIGAKLLYKCFINPTQFLLMLSFPPAILGILVKQKFQKFKQQQLCTEEAMLGKHLLLVLNEPFRESTTGDGSKLCWETVLILRRILLVIAQTFIMSPIIKLYPMTMLLLIFQSHHMAMKPFADDVLNTIEVFALRVLVSLAVVNMFWAFTTEYGIMESHTYRIFGKVAMFYEMFILSLPFILLAFYMLYSLFRVLHRVCKRIYKTLWHKRD